MDIVFGKFVTAFNDFAVGALSPAEYMSKVEDFTYTLHTIDPPNGLCAYAD